MNVLPASEEDAEQIAALERACIECPWSERDLRYALGESRYLFFKAEEGGTIVGYAGVEVVLGEANVQNVAVSPGYRRRGLGRVLVLRLLEAAKGRGATRAFLEVNESNAAAIGLYESLGFAAVSTRKRYYGDAAAIVMSKEL